MTATFNPPDYQPNYQSPQVPQTSYVPPTPVLTLVQQPNQPMSEPQSMEVPQPQYQPPQSQWEQQYPQVESVPQQPNQQYPQYQQQYPMYQNPYQYPPNYNQYQQQPNYNQNYNQNVNQNVNQNEKQKKKEKKKKDKKNKSKSSSSSSSSETTQLIMTQQAIDQVSSTWTLWCFSFGLCTWLCFLFSYSYSRRSSIPSVRLLGNIALGLFFFYFMAALFSGFTMFL